MTPTNWVAVVVAVVAALASMSAAVLARRSARGAQESADGIDRRRHTVEALDAETVAFRAAVAAYFDAIHDLNDQSIAVAQVKMLARAMQVIVHPLCNQDVADGMSAMHRKVRELASVADQASAISTLATEEDLWNGLQSAIRRVIESQARKRRELLAAS